MAVRGSAYVCALCAAFAGCTAPLPLESHAHSVEDRRDAPAVKIGDVVRITRAGREISWLEDAETRVVWTLDGAGSVRREPRTPDPDDEKPSAPHIDPATVRIGFSTSNEGEIEFDKPHTISLLDHKSGATHSFHIPSLCESGLDSTAHAQPVATCAGSTRMIAKWEDAQAVFLWDATSLLPVLRLEKVKLRAATFTPNGDFAIIVLSDRLELMRMRDHARITLRSYANGESFDVEASVPKDARALRVTRLADFFASHDTAIKG